MKPYESDPGSPEAGPDAVAERRLRDDFETLLEVVPAAIWITDTPDCSVIRANGAAHAATATPEGTNVSASAPVAGRRGFREIDGAGPVNPADLPMQKAVRTGEEVLGADLTFLFDDGSTRHLTGNAVPLFAPDGRVRGGIGAFVDVTERRRAEDALRQEAARKDEFLAMLSHELRNPVGAISNAAALLSSPGLPEASVKSAKDVIRRQTAHLTRLVNDLLDTSRLSLGKVAVSRRTISFGPVVSATLEAMRPSLDAHRQTLEADLVAEDLFLEGDEVRLAQIVTNLVANASRYSPNGTTVRVSLAREGGEAVMRVRDEGRGIAPDILPHIFELFVQGEQPGDGDTAGLGIGLNLASRLAKKHGGRLEARSDGPDRGSTFSLHLPLVAPPPDAEPAESRAEEAAPASRRVLIVDDHADSAAGLRALLELDGHDVRCARDGPEALALAAEAAPDVVLLDVGLPGLDGFGVARAMRADPALRHAFLVAVTGYGQDEFRRRASEAGFDAFEVKPVDVERIRRLVGGATVRGAAPKTV